MARISTGRRVSAVGRLLAILCAVALSGALGTACSDGPVSDVEEDLGPIEGAVDEVARTVWPGNDRSDGSRYIRTINGFFDEEPTAYWFIGFASRITADAFFFCRKGDASCPFDAQGHLDPASQVGLPVFARVPGEVGYSPFWLIWVVHVDEDYQPNTIKSAASIQKRADAGELEVSQYTYDHGGGMGPGESILHCLLVLTGTQLERNGEHVVNKPDKPTRIVPNRFGWHKQYKVEFFDFSISERVFSPDDVTESRPLMRFSDIFVMFRECDETSKSPVCGLLNTELPGAISERGVETDMTGDGDRFDTNNVIVAFPDKPPTLKTDKVYSPLWRINVVKVLAKNESKLELIDQSGDQNKTDVKSIKTIRERVAEGLLQPPEFMSEAMAGNAIPGNDGKVFFNCPSQVPDE